MILAICSQEFSLYARGGLDARLEKSAVCVCEDEDAVIN